MSTTLTAYLTPGYWKHGFSLARLAGSLLTALGALWLLTELLVFFELAPNAVTWLKAHWWLFAVGGVAWAFWENRPRHSVSCALKNRDVRIEVRVEDMFSGNSSLIVGCNTSFDTDMANGIISEKSIQGQFTKRFYSNVAHLDTDIHRDLVRPGVPAPVPHPQKRGKQDVCIPSARQ
jgi:hypothetical protein